jgi:DNA-binding FrmR family transcriptional regulator
MGSEEITNRLKRIEGQIRGLQRMVEEQRDCEAILTQLMAARSALDRVGLLVAENFVQQCILAASEDVARERIGRVLELVFSHFSVPAVENGTVAVEPVKLSKED